MDVPDEGKQVVFFVAENGFESIFEEMSGSAVTAVVILGIPGEELAHDG